VCLLFAGVLAVTQLNGVEAVGGEMSGHGALHQLDDGLKTERNVLLGTAQDPDGEDDEPEASDEEEDADADADAEADTSAANPVADPHAAQYLQCKNKADEEESRRLKFEMEAEECSRKLQDVETNIVKAQQKAKEEADLRSKAVAETKHALDEEQKAVKLADQEKQTRENIMSQCEAEIQSLQDANAAAVLTAQSVAKEEESKANTAEEEVKSQADAEHDAIVNQANLDREQQIADLQAERDKEIKLAEDNKNAAIATAEAQALQQETQLKADAALRVQNARAAAEEAIRKAREDRDAAVAAAQAEEGNSVQMLAEMQKQAMEKETLATTMEAERQQAVKDLAKYREWAQAQLASAKDKVMKAMQLLHSTSSIQGTQVDDTSLPSSLDHTIDAANALSKSMEDQIAAAGAGPSSE